MQERGFRRWRRRRTFWLQEGDDYAGDDEGDAAHRFEVDLFFEDDDAKDGGNDKRELVDGGDFGNFAGLECAEVAEPAKEGRESAEEEVDPVFARQALGGGLAGGEGEDGAESDDKDHADEKGGVGGDAVDALLGEDGGDSGEQSREESPDAVVHGLIVAGFIGGGAAAPPGATPSPRPVARLRPGRRRRWEARLCTRKSIGLSI